MIQGAINRSADFPEMPRTTISAAGLPRNATEATELGSSDRQEIALNIARQTLSPFRSPHSSASGGDNYIVRGQNHFGYSRANDLHSSIVERALNTGCSSLPFPLALSNLARQEHLSVRRNARSSVKRPNAKFWLPSANTWQVIQYSRLILLDTKNSQYLLTKPPTKELLC